jgi:hypothetical protein
MGGALDEAGTGVEELIGLPFQCHAPVWAAIGVDIGLLFAAYGKQLQPCELEAAAAGFGQIAPGAKKFHVYPLGPKALRPGCHCFFPAAG